jgi:hypothetical protein
VIEQDGETRSPALSHRAQDDGDNCLVPVLVKIRQSTHHYPVGHHEGMETVF